MVNDMDMEMETHNKTHVKYVSSLGLVRLNTAFWIFGSERLVDLEFSAWKLGSRRACQRTIGVGGSGRFFL